MKDGKECKPCRICGDKAYYNFYGTIACDSCRTFFRRQSLQRNHLICAKRTNNCFINKLTRRVCSRCRMVACLRQGMNPNQVALCESSAPVSVVKAITSTSTATSSLTSTGASSGSSVSSFVSPSMCPSSPTSSSSVSPFSYQLANVSNDTNDDCRPSHSNNIILLDDSSRSSSSRPSSALSLHSTTSSNASSTVIVNATSRGKQHPSSAKSSIITESTLIKALTNQVAKAQINETSASASSSSTSSSLVPYSGQSHQSTTSHDAGYDELNTNMITDDSETTLSSSSLVELLRRQRHSNLLAIPEPYWSLPATVAISGNSCDLTGLTNIEKRRMAEIIEMCNDTRHLQLQFLSIDDRLMNLTGAIEKILYSFSQIIAPRYWSLESMERLNSTDRRVLIEQGLLDLIMIRSIYHFNVETKTWELTCFAKKDANNNRSHNDILDLTTRDANGIFSSLPSRLQFDEVRSNQCDPLGFFASYFKFIESVTFPGLCHDPICSTLWGTICLFNPHNKSLNSPDISQMEMTIYINILRHYIKQRFPDVDVNSAVNFLYKMTSEIITLSRMCAQLPLNNSTHSVQSLKAKLVKYT